MISPIQRQALHCIADGPRTIAAVAMSLDTRVSVSARVLDALYRRNLATITEDGRWQATSRGRNKVAS